MLPETKQRIAADHALSVVLEEFKGDELPLIQALCRIAREEGQEELAKAYGDVIVRLEENQKRIAHKIGDEHVKHAQTAAAAARHPRQH